MLKQFKNRDFWRYGAVLLDFSLRMGAIRRVSCVWVDRVSVGVRSCLLKHMLTLLTDTLTLTYTRTGQSEFCGSWFKFKV